MMQQAGGSTIVGQAKRLYEPGEYRSPVNGDLVPAHVLELENGHTFVVDDLLPARSTVLDEPELRFLMKASEVVNLAVGELGRWAKSMGVRDPQRAMHILVGVLNRARSSLGS